MENNQRWVEENLKLAHLVAQAAQGSTSAFSSLYDLTARWMLAEVRTLVRDGQAEDVLAEAFLQVWKSLDSYDPLRSPAGAWLRMIVRSRCLDHLRREKSRAKVESGEDPGEHGEAGDARHCPERLLSSAEESRLVRLSLSSGCLSVEERNVIGLAYFRDHTQQEIAGITGLPVGTVKSMMARAQDKLRFELAALRPRGGSLRRQTPSP